LGGVSEAPTARRSYWLMFAALRIASGPARDAG
jgi:hypothetical protein